MDVGSKKGYPSSALSNFAAHPFILDDVEINSMEGLLQSLKFDKPHIQVEVCKLTGFAAKSRGRPRNSHWQRIQTLWWKGNPMERKGKPYQEFLDRAYSELYKQNEGFRKALNSTGDAVLTHSLGSNSESKTVLTEREFCRRLMRLRHT